MKLFLPIYESFAGVLIICVDWAIHKLNLLKQIQPIILVLGISLLILAVFSAYLLSKRRGFSNYCKSLQDTSKLRRFLRQQDTINDYTSKTKVNVDQKIYNSALRHTYIDYAKDSMEVRVRIPCNFKAKKLLDSNLNNIAQEVSSYTDKYICSDYIRKGNFYIFKGAKK